MIPGTLELDLRNLVPPAKTPEKCSLKMMDVLEMGVPHKTEHAKSLFAQQSVRGWWPCSIEQDGKKVLGVSMSRKYTKRYMAKCLFGRFRPALLSKRMNHSGVGWEES